MRIEHKLQQKFLSKDSLGANAVYELNQTEIEQKSLRL